AGGEDEEDHDAPVKLAEALEIVAAFSVEDRLEGLKQHLNPDYIEDALTWSGTTSVRRRRLPAEQVVWLVIGMALRRNESIERVADVLGLAQPDGRGSLLAKSGIAQARKRLTAEPLAYLFQVTAAEWAAGSADAHRWHGMAVYGMDGTTMMVADSPENRAAFGGQKSHRGESGYPQVRVVAMMALRSHILSGFRIADYGTGETTLAR